MRHSWDCDLCRLRKSRASPYSLTGKHQTLEDLPVLWVDVIHRAVNDPGRLSERWFKEALSSGLLEDEFV